MGDIIPYTGRLRNQIQFVSVDAVHGFVALVFHVERFQDVVPAAAEAQHQETLKFLPVLARAVSRYLVDFGLVNLDFRPLNRTYFWSGSVMSAAIWISLPARRK